MKGVYLANARVEGCNMGYIKCIDNLKHYEMVLVEWLYFESCTCTFANQLSRCYICIADVFY